MEAATKFMIITILFGLALLLYAVFFGIAVYYFIAPCYDELSGHTLSGAEKS